MLPKGEGRREEGIMFEKAFSEHGLGGGALVADAGGGTKEMWEFERELDFDTEERKKWLRDVGPMILDLPWSQR